MKIINLVKSEFIKNYNIKRFLIIFIVLLLSSFFLIRFTDDLLGKRPDINILQGSIDSFKSYLDRTSQKEIKTFDDYYSIHYSENYIKYMSLLKDIDEVYYDDWKALAIGHELLPIIMQNYLIERIKDNPNDSYIINVCKSDVDGVNSTEKELRNLCDNYKLDELDELYNKNIITIKDYEKLLNDNKYYLYLEYQIKNGLIKEDEFIRLLIDKKVESSISYLGLNYLQYKSLEENSKIKILSLNEYENMNYVAYDSYKDYVHYNTKLRNDAINNRKILLYSSKNEIKHDIQYNYDDSVNDSDRYMNTKLKVNQVFHLSVVVIIIVGITGGGIVSNEHSKGTIKNIITTPVRRWKILASKFIYLILDMYIVWLLGLIVISILSGIEYGFSDLFTPKLIVFNGNVLEVNYYFYILKNIFIASIPVICFLSILFFLSTVFLNTSLTVGISVILGIVSPFMWLLSMPGNFKQIVYTPLWYFDLGFMFSNSQHYIESLKKISYSLSTGIIISIIVIIILYTISNIVYIKRDIKN